MKIDNFSIKQSDAIHLAFDPDTLESLIREGKLHVSDFNCLDKTSKKGVWALMRSVAAATIRLS
ncbi:MAG: hypothetical protein PSN44_01625 [Gammaproteobacteria bacterium]|nr:hypothetical protein [Gammaproteobacteria bacterium]